MTASAALDSRPVHARLRASSTPATARSTASASTTPTRPAPFGRLDLHTALAALDQLGLLQHRQGARRAGRSSSYAKRFGFYSLPPLETPANERAPSGLYKGTKLFDPTEDTEVDPGRLAFGQERLLVTPLQMAMVAATIANDGVVMQPYVVDRIVAPGRRRSSCARSREELGRGDQARDGAGGRRDDEAAVEGGTGTAAQIPGVTVAGKTGTAETGIAGPQHDVVHRFAPADEPPQVAIAVVVENQNSTGGTTAAPIAREVMQALLGAAANS